MSNTTSESSYGKASTERKTFSRTTTIQQLINAEAAVVWQLLTDAADFARWNSTVISIEGQIKPGEKIKLKSTLAPKRTFKLKVKEAVPSQKLVWGDAMGQRTYSLKQEGQQTHFTMTEKIGGLMFPLFAGQIPPFDEAFEQFTADLKAEAESKN